MIYSSSALEAAALITAVFKSILIYLPFKKTIFKGKPRQYQSHGQV